MKKAQAASEFLMTYGWVILAVMLAISALAYLGVFDSKMVIEKCLSEFGMDCVDKAVVTESGVAFALRQNLGFDAEISELSSSLCNDRKGGVSGTTDTLILNDIFQPFNVSNNEVFRLGLGCSLNKGEIYKDSISFAYINKETGLTHRNSVEIYGLIT
jgi:hypothetical protein